MEYRNDELKKDIDEIKSDISILKIGIISVVQHLNLNIAIQGLEINNNSQESFTDSTPDATQNTSTPKIVAEAPLASIEFFLIDPSFSKSEEVRRILVRYDKNLQSCKRERDFLQFCHFAVSLVEDFVKRFIDQKFQELSEERNVDVLEGYSLLEKEYQERNFILESAYVEESVKLSRCQNTPTDEEKFYFDSNRHKYLSLISLKRAKLHILIDLCFATIYKSDFYNQKNSSRFISSGKNSQVQASSPTFQRPVPKSKADVNKFQTKYYYKISNAKTFRNIYEHNKDNESDQKQEIERLKPIIKADFEQYDAILEAILWFIHQL